MAGESVLAKIKILSVIENYYACATYSEMKIVFGQKNHSKDNEVKPFYIIFFLSKCLLLICSKSSLPTRAFQQRVKYMGFHALKTILYHRTTTDNV